MIQPLYEAVADHRIWLANLKDYKLNQARLLLVYSVMDI